MTWILILTMWSADSKFMLQVPGFVTEAKCAKAAELWTAQNGMSSGFHRGNAICVLL